MKYIYCFFAFLIMCSCAQVKQLNVFTSNSDEDKAIKQVLLKGVNEEVNTIAVKDGFKNNKDLKIKLPDEYLKVEEALKAYKLGTLKKEGLNGLNATAEDAVKNVTPLLIKVIEKLKIKEEESIVKGDNNAATMYLKENLKESFYEEFSLIVKNSYTNVGAEDFWKKLIRKHNKIRSVTRVSSDMTDYVTEKTLEAIFKKISIKEEMIRNNTDLLDTEELKLVFGNK